MHVPHDTFEQIADLWDNDKRTEMVWVGALANAMPGYPESLGLNGTLRFENLQHVPYFRPFASDTTQLATDFRDGVPIARRLEWMLSIMHPSQEKPS